MDALVSSSLTFARSEASARYSSSVALSMASTLARILLPSLPIVALYELLKYTMDFSIPWFTLTLTVLSTNSGIRDLEIPVTLGLTWFCTYLSYCTRFLTSWLVPSAVSANFLAKCAYP